jgi:hypothetical protein
MPVSTYPSGGADQYYVNDPQQHGAYQGPLQFDPYNHPPPDPYDQGEYRDAYADEPVYSIPQGQSMEPLGPNTKEEVYYADEANPVPRIPRCVNWCTASAVSSGLLMVF